MREVVRALTTLTCSQGGVLFTQPGSSWYVPQASPTLSPTSPTSRHKSRLNAIVEVGDTAGIDVAEVAARANLAVHVNTTFPEDSPAQYRASASKAYLSSVVTPGTALLIHRREPYSKVDEQNVVLTARLLSCMCSGSQSFVDANLLLHRTAVMQPGGEEVSIPSGIVTEAQQFTERIGVLLRSKTAKLNHSELKLKAAQDEIEGLLKQRVVADHNLLLLAKRCKDLTLQVAVLEGKQPDAVHKGGDAKENVVRGSRVSEGGGSTPNRSVGSGASKAYEFFERTVKTAAGKAVVKIPVTTRCAESRYTQFVYKSIKSPPVPCPPEKPAHFSKWNGQSRPPQPFKNKTFAMSFGA